MVYRISFDPEKRDRPWWVQDEAGVREDYRQVSVLVPAGTLAEAGEFFHLGCIRAAGVKVVLGDHASIVREEHARLDG